MPNGFENAAALLPAALRKAIMSMPEGERDSVEEIRLRLRREPTVVTDGNEKVFCRAYLVKSEDLCIVMENATSASVYSVSQQLRRGFVTAPGGIRVGVCGSIVGECETQRDFTSLAIRIPRQIFNAGEKAAEKLDMLSSVLIISPPGGGKTTFLRELIRRASDRGLRTAVSDERMEIAAFHKGEPCFDLGRCTDVLCGGTKAEGAMMLLRAMNPQIIAFDEISAPEDATAVESILNCGVKVYATAHASDMSELRRKEHYGRLLDKGAFRYCISINGTGRQRMYRVTEL